MSSPTFYPELRRKAFHLAGLIYVAGLYLLERPTFIITLSCLMAVQLLFEFLRLRVPSMNTLVRGLMREHEHTHISGMFWMMLGVWSTALLVRPVAVAATVLLYLILGDGVASLGGKFFEGPRWTNSRKRLSGSASCFTTCLVVGFLMLRPEYGWHGVVIGALTATTVEFGFIKLNDNLTIPVACSIALMLSYGLKPFFL